MASLSAVPAVRFAPFTPCGHVSPQTQRAFDAMASQPRRQPTPVFQRSSLAAGLVPASPTRVERNIGARGSAGGALCCEFFEVGACLALLLSCCSGIANR